MNASGSATVIASGTRFFSRAADLSTIRRSAVGAAGAEMSSGIITMSPRSTAGKGFSKSTDGSMRSSQAGSHQFHSANIAIKAGTITSRTTVASTAIATAHATPISATSGIPANAKTKNNASIISTALGNV